MKRIGATIAVLTILTAGGLLLRSQQKNDPVEELRVKVQQLEMRVQRLEQAVQLKPQNTLSANLKAKFDARWAQDQQHFTKQELSAIETLYQEASQQGVWGTEESVRKLRTLVSMYKSADRVGCAYLYLGQLTSGVEREQYLKKAIAEYSDSMYGDTVQVGAYARFLLVTDYLQSGRKAEAEELFSVIRAQYPDAVDHSGMRLAPQIPK
jgi:hypothetical protein